MVPTTVVMRHADLAVDADPLVSDLRQLLVPALADAVARARNPLCCDGHPRTQLFRALHDFRSCLD
jgi:hypothetical protein